MDFYEEEKRLYNINRLGGLMPYEDFTLEKYSNTEAVNLCKEYPECNLFIYGSTGAGKTHLAVALLRQSLHKGRIVGLATKPQQIYRDCRGHETSEDEQSCINSYVNMPYLLIDDLGVEKRTDWSFSTLYEIIDGRWLNKKKGLIVTSNLSLGLLAERMGDNKIISRISGMCKIIEIKSEDRRLDFQKSIPAIAEKGK